jgi:hypothetical protein
MSGRDNFSQQAKLCMRLARIAAVQEFCNRLQQMAEEQKLIGEEFEKKSFELLPSVASRRNQDLQQRRSA